MLKLDKIVVAIATLTCVLALVVVHVERTRRHKAENLLATERAERAQVAMEHYSEIARLRAQHATEQQEKTDALNQKIADIQDERTADSHLIADLRLRIKAATTSGRRPGETDASACLRAQHQLPVIGELLAEGVELESESRAIIRQRDAEIEVLQGIILADRKACSMGGSDDGFFTFSPQGQGTQGAH